MPEDTKVFSSDITRSNKLLQNNLYDMINVVPAIPSTSKNGKEYFCHFQPRNDKHYVPKKRNKHKVKTVRDIRNLMEKDIYTYLPNELEKQQHVLLKKITGGSARKDHTKSLANNMIKSENPVSRTAWQMLMNLNPENHAHCIQYVLWNGKYIRVNGSKGGKSKFLCNFDLGLKKVPLQNMSFFRKKTTEKKKSLLNNSLTVKFKPGPLRRKKYLDDSYQKYNFGSTELVNLPNAGLDIRPAYGVVLEPTIINFLQHLRDADGNISEKWAEFSVSVLGKLDKSNPIQNDIDCCVTFDLNYKSNQSLLLMRRDVGKVIEKERTSHDVHLKRFSENEESNIVSKVKAVLDDLLNSVEINIKQDEMYSGYDEPREITSGDVSTFSSNAHVKDKLKRNLELDRLDVTIIRLPEVSQKDELGKCQKSYCTLGCICHSLRSSYILKEHCGRVECMFECKCDFSKYKITETFESTCPELIPGLLNLDNEINLKLAKEEQKFHQTVVVTGEKSILLKSQKRNWKATKRYADFYNNMCLKTEIKTKKLLSVISLKLNCENVEPWCMVHNLYKCFCKGKFTNSTALLEQTEVNETITHPVVVSDEDIYGHKNNGVNIRTSVPDRERLTSKTIERNFKRSSTSDVSDTVELDLYAKCARVKPYRGRKYYDSYYLITNKKISEMERNDDKLHKKMMSLIDKVDCTDDVNSDKHLDYEQVSQNKKIQCEQNKLTDCKDSNSQKQSKINVSMPSIDNYSSGVTDLTIKTSLAEDVSCHRSMLHDVSQSSKNAPNKTKLVAWLESSYKQYKQRIDRGIVKTSLDPPKEGKVALYPWEFILSRYKERKNLFMISKQKPFRIFMAVETKHGFFENCINIDDIRFAELGKYPATIKNLLTNATDLKDNFCILCGLSHCWELIGSVAKVVDQADNGAESKMTDLENNTLPDSTLEDSIRSEKLSNICQDAELNIQEITEEDIYETETNLDTSKWFVMTVENDFHEIQFFKKGFFVKYESIIKAINVARMSGKTVRLSSQKCFDQNSGPQFGIYAIPNVNEFCVFIGPYNQDEPLGIETVKSISDIKKLKTRGVWITTKKVDNLKVIDNPLSFMPPNNLDPSKIVSLESESLSVELAESVSNSRDDKEILSPAKVSMKDVVKVVKPIKIRKTNGFYHLAPEGFLKHIMHHRPQKDKQTPVPIAPKGFMQQFLLQNPKPQYNQILVPPPPSILNSSLIKSSTTAKETPFLNHPTHFESTPLLKTCTSDSTDSTDAINASPQRTLANIGNKKPVAEIAPQIKIVGIYSESGTALECNNLTPKKTERGMFVLKPEEINKRLMERKQNNAETISKNIFSSDVEMNLDIENFLATSDICTIQNSDVLIISDEENSCHNHNVDSKTDQNVKNVWIASKTIENFGCIRGKMNSNSELSFEFPGFKFTEFYTEEEAFSKINQVLSRKVYVHKNLNLEWHILESEEELQNKHLLRLEEFGTDLVLTKRGLKHKGDLLAMSKIRSTRRFSTSSSASNCNSKNEDSKASDLCNELEQKEED